MSKYNLGTIQTADYEQAQGPYIGGHWQLLVSLSPSVLIGTLDWDGTTATYTDNPTSVLPAAPTGADLQIVCGERLVSSDGSAPVIAFAGMDNTATPVAMQGSATFAPPGYALDQSKVFQAGWAMDLVPATNGKLFTAITGPAASTPVLHAKAGARFLLYQLPDITTYTLVGGMENPSWSSKARTPHDIADGTNASAWTVMGMTQAGSFEFSALCRGFGEMPARLDGAKCTAMLVAMKDGVLKGDRAVFTGVGINMSCEGGTGDGNSMWKVTGKFRDQLLFVAP